MLREITTPEGFAEAVLVILAAETSRMILIEVEKPVMMRNIPESNGNLAVSSPMGNTMSLKIFVRVRECGVLDVMRYIVTPESNELTERCITYNGSYTVEWAEKAGPACTKNRTPYSVIDEFELINPLGVQPDVR